MTTPSASPALKQVAFGDLEHELTTTRRVLERVPDERLSWKPHEKSWTFGKLALHLANLLFWQISILRHDEFDLASLPASSQAKPASRDQILQTFDRNAVELREALDEAGDAALMEPWTLRRGDQIIFTQPRAAVLRGMGISHLVHHRGQLGVYLRLLDVPVPATYGPSADEGGV